MRGVVFNVLEDVVSAERGEDGWDDLLEQAGVDGGYTAIGSYPDNEFLHLLQCLSGSQSLPSSITLRAFGRSGMARLATLYPAFFAPHRTTASFLLTLNDIIHPAVRCLYPGADVPVFDVTVINRARGDDLVIGYRSRRRLCHLAEGFLEGAAAHYGEQAALHQVACMHDGADECVIACTFTPVEPT